LAGGGVTHIQITLVGRRYRHVLSLAASGSVAAVQDAQVFVSSATWSNSFNNISVRRVASVLRTLVRRWNYDRCRYAARSWVTSPGIALIGLICTTSGIGDHQMINLSCGGVA